MNHPVRFGPVPVRFASKAEAEAPLRPLQEANQPEEMYRFVAKIRSLEDDIRNLRNQNRGVQTDNQNMVRTLDELEKDIEFQIVQIEKLSEELQQNNSTGSSIMYYQEQLKAVGQKVDNLHQLIAEKNRRFDILKDERDRAVFEQLKLKEQCNQLQYQQNKLLEGIDGIIGGINHGQQNLNLDIQTKVEFAVEYCQSLESQVQEIGVLLGKSRKEGGDTVMLWKQKRIKSTYNIQLLRQRWRDYQTKRNYFKSCYNQESIQAVIDDMLRKESSLSQQISLQTDRNKQLDQQREEALLTFQKRITREKLDLQQQLKNQELQCHKQTAKKEKVLNEIRKIQKKMVEIQEEGYLVTQESREKESQIYKKISAIESQNVRLEKELGELRREMDVLQLGFN